MGHEEGRNKAEKGGVKPEAVFVGDNQKGGKMNKAELIEKVSERVQIPSNAAKVVVNTIFDSMRESLK